ncbi:MAG TPA: hypothetical protein VFP12_12420, partial [Allosphingosinicella sp.]|nr:hypothetical protein [Allosphingosinicella sp.]
MAQLYRRKGADTLVNTQTTSDQIQPDVAVLAGGGYVIVWGDSSLVGGDSSGSGIKGQRFDADGNKVGGEFLVNTTIAGGQVVATIAALPSGRFVVTWSDPSATGGDTSSFAVRGQMFEADGTPVGSEFLINTVTSGNQSTQQVTALAGGGFAVSWSDASAVGNDTSGFGIKAQLFDSAGAKVGGEISVNTTTAGAQNSSSVIGLPSGGLAVSWISAGNSTMVQLFDSTGAKVGAEIQVNAANGPGFGRGTIAALADGFVVTWTQLNSDFGLGTDVRAQRFDLNGAKVGSEFVVHASLPGNQAVSDAVSLPGGGFIITWQGPEAEGSTAADVFGQIFDSAGARVGVEFVVSSVVNGDQLSPKVAAMPSGDIIVTWTDGSGTGADTSGFAVRSQILTLAPAAPTDIALSPAAVSETAIGNIAVATLSATGALNTTFTYELLDDAGGAFRIEGDRLVVADNSLLDFETDPTMEITVRATDMNGLNYTEVLTVAISDVALEKRYSMGLEFRVNDDQSGIEVNGTPIALSNGGFAVLFTQNEVGPEGTETRVRFFDADGTPTSGDIVLDDRNWFDFSVTPLANGGFLTARSAPYEPDLTQSLRVQAWDSAGNPVGPETLLDVSENSLPINSSAVQLSTGGYLVAWQGQNGMVKGQLFGADGMTIGSSFLLALNAGYQFAIAATPDGGFAVSRLEYATGPEDTAEIKTQFYNSTGVPTGVPVSVEVGVTDFLSMTLIALEGGGYILGWRELVPEVYQHEVKAQAIGADGLAIGGPVLLATTAADYTGASLQFIAHPDGGFLATWTVTGGDYTVLNGQLFDASGQPVGTPFEPIAPNGALAILADGTIVAAWSDEDSHSGGTYAKLYSPSDAPPDLSGDNVLTGDANANLLDGQGGNDQLYGLGGADELIGGTGNDLLDGGSGADTMTGGEDNDIYVVDDSGDVVVEDMGEGIDEIRTSL